MALEDQTEAVFKTVRKDPVSGNDVPAGSLPEEVRDDIPAQLSEGEYVVPADVVRYYGVKFFEDLRMDAKRGFAEMDADGRIGGEPLDEMEIVEPEDDLPFDISELKTVEAAEGAFITGYQEGGVATVPSIYSPAATGVTYEEYTNGEKTISIPFFGGVPMAEIPDGYMPVAQFNAQKKKETTAQVDDGGDDGPDIPQPEAIDYKNLTDDELQKMVNDQTSFGADDVMGGLVAAINPIAGILIQVAMAHQQHQTQKELQRRIADTSGTYPAPVKAKYEELLEQSKTGKGSILNILKGKKEEPKEEEEQTVPPPFAPFTEDEKIKAQYDPTAEAPAETKIEEPPIISVENLTPAGQVTTPTGTDDGSRFEVNKVTYTTGEVAYIVTDKTTGQRALEGLQETSVFQSEEEALKEVERLEKEKSPTMLTTSPTKIQLPESGDSSIITPEPLDPLVDTSKDDGGHSAAHKAFVEKQNKLKEAKSSIEEAAKKDPSAGIYTGGGRSGGFGKGGLVQKPKKK